MSDSLLGPLEPVMLPGESFIVHILRAQNGFVMLVRPQLGKKPTDLPKEAEETRAVLKIPLRLAGSAQELDAVFSAKVRGWGAARRETFDSLQALIDTHREASKQAQAKTAQAKKKMATPPRPQANASGSTSPPAPEPETSPAGTTPPAAAECGSS